MTIVNITIAIITTIITINKVAVKHDLPLILHSRKAEKRVLEMLIEEGVQRADFHCFCGKVLVGGQG